MAKKLSTEGEEDKRVGDEEALRRVRAHWKIMDTEFPIDPDPEDHPITGNATVIVTLQPRRFIKKIGRTENHIVNIGTDGKAEYLGKSNASKAVKVLRSANERLALSRFIKGAYKTKGFKSRLAVTAATGIAYAMGKIGWYEMTQSIVEGLPLVFVMTAMYTLESLKTGRTNRDAARELVFNEMTSKYLERIHRGSNISLKDAYKQYGDQFLTPSRLGSRNIESVTPLRREEFVLSLYPWELEHFPLPTADYNDATDDALGNL